MSTEANRAVVHAYLEMYASGDLGRADHLIAPGFVDHTHPDTVPGPADVKRMVATVRAAFPDLSVMVERMIAEDDLVAFQFILTGTHLGIIAGVTPTGERVTISGMDFVRIKDGLLTDLWSVQDSLRWLVQLGAVQWTTGAGA